ncbi:hypothetical protein ACC763_41830, partial [Rhizobium ruizarguesonis]
PKQYETEAIFVLSVEVRLGVRNACLHRLDIGSRRSLHIADATDRTCLYQTAKRLLHEIYRIGEGIYRHDDALAENRL